MESKEAVAYQKVLQERLVAGDQKGAVKACEDFELDHLWKHEIESAYELILTTKWAEPLSSLSVKIVEGLRSRNLKLVAESFSTIAVQDCAKMLGMAPSDAVKRCKELGWKEEGEFLKPVIPAEEGAVSMGKEQLQELTDYVCKLDAR